MVTKHPVNLKSIADEAGVSITTVHRALSGKKDCSEKMRNRIIDITKREGYEFNYNAASLRKKSIRIACIFRQKEVKSRYFVERMYEGFDKYKQNISNFKMEYSYFYYKNDDHSLENAIKTIIDESARPYDAIVVHAISITEDQLNLMNMMVGMKIPVVMLESNPSSSEDVCTVSTDNLVSGSLAGEIISKTADKNGTVVIFSQLMNKADENAREAEKEIRKRRGDLKIVEKAISIDIACSEDFISVINGCDDIVAVYSTCARHTATLLDATKGRKAAKVVIGSEMFEETFDALQHDILDAVIDKRPDEIGNRALEVLFSNIVKKEKMEMRYQVEPFLILKANSLVRFNEIRHLKLNRELY